MVQGAKCMVQGSLTIVALGVSALLAQAPAADSPAFEVASIKPNKSGLPNTNFGLQPGGRFSATNAQARELIRMAYAVPDLQIVDAPDWTRDERFNIVAKAPGNPPVDTVLTMLRTLLADRFKLLIRHENRELPVYALVRVRPDGTLGPRMKPAAADCQSIMAAARNGVRPPASDRMQCGSRYRPGSLQVGGLSMSGVTGIASAFWPLVGRIVVDRTGLEGRFDFDLDFTPEPASSATPMSNESPSNGASIFTAVQEQLGLKLEAARAPVDVLVIAHVERPTPD